MSESFEIYQGDTGPILRPRPTVLGAGEVIGAGWACRIAVNEVDGNEAMAARAVTEKTSDDLRWVAALTPTETAALSHGRTYDMVIEVENLGVVPPFRVEKHYSLTVAKPGIS